MMNRIFTTVVCLAGCCLLACATSNQSQDTANRGFYHQSPPPTDLDLTINDPKPRKHEITLLNEEDRYERSLANIITVFEAEGLNHQICLKAYPREKCRQIFCTIDELVDSKGYWHKKPYCR